jgi:hypothetical protein
VDEEQVYCQTMRPLQVQLGVVLYEHIRMQLQLYVRVWLQADCGTL